MARLKYNFAIMETRYPIGRQPIVVVAQDLGGNEYAYLSHTQANRIAATLRETRRAGDGEYDSPTYNVHVQ